MNLFQNFLGRITMYRLMLYFLSALLLLAVVLSATGMLLFDPVLIAATALYLIAVCYLSNQILAWLFKTRANPESQFITALILSLIVGPANPIADFGWLAFIAVAAMASKYLVAKGKRHIFNPAAFGVTLSAIILGQGASWWVGSKPMLLFVLAGGLIMARRLRWFHLIASFLITYFVLSTIKLGSLSLAYETFSNILINSSLLFFCFVMMVEPMTAPFGKRMRIFYGALVAALFAGLGFWTSLPYSLELSLLAANLTAWLIRWKTTGTPKIILTLAKKENVATNTFSFWFETRTKINFKAGQFLEWTLSHDKPDLRGFRRWFTIAASSTENNLMLTTKFSDKSSSFKQALQSLKIGDEITAEGPDGDFNLPSDRSEKCIFIAGGIGITPFRSMIKYLLDTNQSQPIVLMYSNKTAAEIAFQNIWNDAEKKFGLKTVYTLTNDIPKDWTGRTGFIDPAMIKQEVPDWIERTFYVSGPEPMVEAFEKMLAGMGVAKKKINRDYFPGYVETYQEQKTA